MDAVVCVGVVVFILFWMWKIVELCCWLRYASAFYRLQPNEYKLHYAEFLSHHPRLAEKAYKLYLKKGEAAAAELLSRYKFELVTKN